MRRRLGTIIAAAAALLALTAGVAAAGGGGGGNACDGYASGTEIIIRDSCFEGTAHFADAGETIVVQNHGRIPHTFTASDGSFDSGLLQRGDTFELTVDDPGVVRFFCTPHGSAEGRGMAGVLVVGDLPGGDTVVAGMAEGTLGTDLPLWAAGLVGLLLGVAATTIGVNSRNG